MKPAQTAPQKFAGNPFFSPGTLFLLLAFAGMIYSFITQQSFFKENEINRPIFVLVFAALYFILGLKMNYFIIDGNSLFIKNHYFFWMKTSFDIRDIVSAGMEWRWRAGNMFLFTTKYSEKWSYIASSLRRKDWRSFKEKLASFGIDIIS